MKKTMEIDINCDMGESYGNFTVGNDTLIFPHITSCNIACGFHGGDPLHIENTIKKALDYEIQIGAHPSYPDILGFGRRKISMKKSELKTAIKYQLAALKGMTESLGGKLAYVKPHGALYNEMATNEAEALTVIEAIKEIDPELALMGLAGSPLENLAKRAGIIFIPEAFADRQYETNGQLMSRAKENAVITDSHRAAEQVLSIVLHKRIETLQGDRIPVNAQSICVHGDNPAAIDILKTITMHLEENNIVKRKFNCS